MKEEKFELDSDGIKVRGKIFKSEFGDPARPGRTDQEISAPAVIILHGIPRSKPAPDDPGYLPLARELTELGFLTIFFNFRGAGESEGNFNILGWSQDLRTVIDWLVQKHSPERIALIGFSGGASVAIYNSARDERISALVSVSSPAYFSVIGIGKEVELWLKSFREIGLIRDPKFPESISKWLKEFEEIAPINWIAQLSPRPILIMHGEKDEVVPKRHAEMLYEKAKAPKELYWVKDGLHRLRIDKHAINKAENWLLAWKEGM